MTQFQMRPSYVKSLFKVSVWSKQVFFSVGSCRSGSSFTVLGIETSCDDTAVGVVQASKSSRTILAERKYNQWSTHKNKGAASTKGNVIATAFGGGVVPNVARLLHRQNLVYAVSDCIKSVSWQEIDAIALTVKPGLEPCLWEGIQFTKLLLHKYKLPFIPIHHMEAHALMPRLFDDAIKFPFLTLLISGGHCILALVESDSRFWRLGESLDISPGNLIDRIARKLGLFHLNETGSTSGGALLELYAKQGNADSFPHLIKSVEDHCRRTKNCDFSFAGFFSASSRLIDKLVRQRGDNSRCVQVSGEEKRILSNGLLNDVCANVQKIVSLQLEDRLKRALKFLQLRHIEISSVAVSGGVASNMYIKSRLEAVCAENRISMSIPPVSYCTDNGVMIAWNGCEKLLSTSQSEEAVIRTSQQDAVFFEGLRPIGKCKLGTDISSQIKLLQIKN